MTAVIERAATLRLPGSPAQPHTIGVDRVLVLLGEVVAEVGEDHVLPCRGWERGACASDYRYVWQGRPDCITARVLVRLGVEVEYLLGVEGVPAGIVLREGMLYPLDLSDDAIRVLEVAQRAQDTGRTWGAVLAVASECAGAR